MFGIMPIDVGELLHGKPSGRRKRSNYIKSSSVVPSNAAKDLSMHLLQVQLINMLNFTTILLLKMQFKNYVVVNVETR